MFGCPLLASIPLLGYLLPWTLLLALMLLALLLPIRSDACLLAWTLISLDHWMFSCFDASWLGILDVEFYFILFYLVACRYSPRSFCSLRCCSLRYLVAWMYLLAFDARSNTFACLLDAYRFNSAEARFDPYSLRSLLALIIGCLARSDSFICFTADACSYARLLRYLVACWTIGRFVASSMLTWIFLLACIMMLNRLFA